MLVVVAPVLQLYDTPPEAVRVCGLPGQSALVLAIVIVGPVPIVTEAVAVKVHPPA